MGAQPKPAIVARNPCIVPKQRRIEPLDSGYAVRELCGNSEGYYWYVVIALGVIRPARRRKTGLMGFKPPQAGL